MIKLIKNLYRLREHRKEYRIRAKFAWEYDNHNYCFSFLPTIVWNPWICRHTRFYVVEFWWLNFHLCFGRWEKLDCRECKNQEKCIDEGRIKWYGDNIFDTEYCEDYEGR